MVISSFIIIIINYLENLVIYKEKKVLGLERM